jgi:hypothetical protein
MGVKVKAEGRLAEGKGSRGARKASDRFKYWEWNHWTIETATRAPSVWSSG